MAPNTANLNRGSGSGNGDGGNYNDNDDTFAYCVGSPAWNPAQYVADTELQARVAAHLEKDDFYSAIAEAFSLRPRRGGGGGGGGDTYVYHAMVSVTLAQTQHAVSLGGADGLHAWYRDPAHPASSPRPHPSPPPRQDVDAYLAIFDPVTTTHTALRSFAANARGGSVRRRVADYLSGKRFLHPALLPALEIPRVRPPGGGKNKKGKGKGKGKGKKKKKSNSETKDKDPENEQETPDNENDNGNPNNGGSNVGQSENADIKNADNYDDFVDDDDDKPPHPSQMTQTQTQTQTTTTAAAVATPPNPYLVFAAWACRALEWCGPCDLSATAPGGGLRGHPVLPVLMHHFGCACPSHEALEMLRVVSAGRTVVDAGSGNGYWTFMLRAHGVPCVAVDSGQSAWRTTWVRDTVRADAAAWLSRRHRRRRQQQQQQQQQQQREQREQNGDVDKGGVKDEDDDDDDDVVLLVVYPIVGGVVGGEEGGFTRGLLQAYAGDTLAVVGTQNRNGYTGFRGRSMDEYMAAEQPDWVRVAQVPLPSFPGKDEALFIFQRGARAPKPVEVEDVKGEES